MKTAARSRSWRDDRWLVASCLAVALLVSLGYSFSARPRFEAAAEIQIDAPGPGLATPDWWESEGRRLREISLLSRVISKYELAGSPELTAGPMLTPLERALRRLKEGSALPLADDAAPAALLSRLSVRPGEAPNRFVVVVRAYDAKFTALAANGLGRTFVDDAAQTASGQRGEPAEWLQARLGAPTRDQEPGSETPASIADRRRSLESALAQAQARTVRAAEAAQASKERVEGLRRAAASDRFDGSELGTSQAVQSARRDLADIDARRANLEQSLGPRHPDVMAIHERLFRQREVLAAEVGRVLHEVEAAAESSAHAASAEGDAAAALRAQLAALALAGAPAETVRRETAMPVGNPTPAIDAEGSSLGREGRARFITAATVPPHPYSPDMIRNLEIAAAAGLVFGVFLARLRSGLEAGAAPSVGK